MTNPAFPYQREKFSTAVALMATSPASIQERLMLAYGSFHPVIASDFASDPELQDAYNEIMERLTADKSGPPNVGYVPTTIQGMSEAAAVEVANLIVDFASMLR